MVTNNEREENVNENVQQLRKNICYEIIFSSVTSNLPHIIPPPYLTSPTSFEHTSKSFTKMNKVSSHFINQRRI